LDAEGVGHEAGLVAAQAAVDRGLPGEKRIDLRDAEAEVGGGAVEREVETAAREQQRALGYEIDRAAEVAAGKGGEGGEVVGADGVAAVVDEILDRAGGGEREAGTGDLESVDGKRRVGGDGDVGAKVDALAERLDDGRVGRGEAAGGTLGLDGDVAGRGVLEILGAAAHGEGDLVHAEFGRGEATEREIAAPAVALTIAHVERAGAKRRLAAGDGEGNRAVLLAADAAGQRELAEKTVRPGLEAAVEVEGFGGDGDLVEAEA